MNDGLNIAVRVAAPVAIAYALWTHFGNVSGERMHSAYRLALKIVLIYLLWQLVPAVRSYTNLVIGTARESQAIKAQQRKLSAADLESILIRDNTVPTNSELRCAQADRNWDYVCSYMPTPAQSKTRVEFGVMVNEKRWVDVSGIVPAGTTVPPPQRGRL